MELPVFELALDGFPIPGPVVRYFREHMTYIDINGKERRWTQADLAKRLGISELMVRYMETKNQGLDSIERRKTIAALLKIPPALLGLASLDDLHKIIQSEKPTQIASSKKEVVNTEEIQLYHDALGILKEKYDKKQLNPQLILPWIARINTIKDKAHGDMHIVVLTALAKYHVLTANTYFYDLQNEQQSMHHLNIARDISGELQNTELLAMTQFYTGVMCGAKQNHLLARKELDLALNLSKSASPQIRGNILTCVTQAYAMTSSDEITTVQIRKLLDQAEECIRETTDPNSLMAYDTVQYLENRADTFISLKRYQLALECIDDAEEYNLSRQRNAEYLKILRAECHIKQRKPEYDEALRILSQVLDDNKNIQYYVNYVARLHKLIATSSYGNAPDVVDLGMVLRQIQTKPR